MNRMKNVMRQVAAENEETWRNVFHRGLPPRSFRFLRFFMQVDQLCITMALTGAANDEDDTTEQRENHFVQYFTPFFNLKT